MCCSASFVSGSASSSPLTVTWPRCAFPWLWFPISWPWPPMAGSRSGFFLFWSWSVFRSSNGLLLSRLRSITWLLSITRSVSSPFGFTTGPRTLPFWRSFSLRRSNRRIRFFINSVCNKSLRIEQTFHQQVLLPFSFRLLCRRLPEPVSTVDDSYLHVTKVGSVVL